MKLLRGNTSAVMVIIVSVIMAMLAFLPPSSASAGAAITLLLLLLILHVNLFIAFFVFILAKVVQVQNLFSASEVGQKLLNGDQAAFFETLINAPVTAYWGLEHYEVAGGVAIGLIVGLVISAILLFLLYSIRWYFNRKAYVNELLASRSFIMRFFLWFLTSSNEEDYQKYLKGSVGNPFRKFGVVLIIITLILAQATVVFFKEMGGVERVEAEIEKVHGASVDIENIKINLFTSTVTVQSIQLADPKNLRTNLVQAKSIKVDVDPIAIAKKHYVINKIIIHDVIQGANRARKAELFDQSKATKPDMVDKKEKSEQSGELKGITDYFSNSDDILNDLSGMKRWIGQAEIEKPAVEDESIKKAKQKKSAEKGIANHLVKARPIEIKYIQISPIATKVMRDETFGVKAYKVTLQDKNIIKPLTVKLSSSQDKLKGNIKLKPHTSGQPESDIDVQYKGISVNSIKDKVKLPDGVHLQDGTIDVLIAGSWVGGAEKIHVPASITIHNSELTTKELGKLNLDEFTIPLTIKGSLAKPKFDVDQEKLTKALLVLAGKNIGDIATDKLQEAVEKEVGKKLEKEVGGLLGIGGALDSKDKKKDSAGSKEDSTDSLKEAGEKLIKGLFD